MSNLIAPSSSSPLFASALDLYGESVQLAQTDLRIINDRIRLHALRILEHASTAASAESSRTVSRSLYYARLSLAKLYAAVEAAWTEALISDDQRGRVKERIRRFETQIDQLRTPKPVSADKPSGAEEKPANRVLTPRDLIELGKLAERDSCSAPQRERLDDAGLRWSG